MTECWDPMGVADSDRLCHSVWDAVVLRPRVIPAMNRASGPRFDCHVRNQSMDEGNCPFTDAFPRTSRNSHDTLSWDSPVDLVTTIDRAPSAISEMARSIWRVSSRRVPLVIRVSFQFKRINSVVLPTLLPLELDSSSQG